MTCMIVDDEPLAVKLLESFVGRTPDLQLVSSFTDSVAAIAALREQPVDLIFLDIQMPDLNGMELAHMLPPQTKIIFTTAFKEYAFDSYEVSAVDFLLKPVRYNKFLTAVEKAKRRASPQPPPKEGSSEPAKRRPSLRGVWVEASLSAWTVSCAKCSSTTSSTSAA